ncbi:MAG: thioredoxin domain-containing protein [Myxococcales bacterium]|nr:MAG: thioredoxin domain-containing protein [Myxococcales bacterium]
MSKGSATIVALMAFVGGLLIGNLTAGKFGSSAELSAEAETIANEEGIERFNIPVDENAPKKGADDPLVTIVEFSDFQCPFCSRVNPTVAQILDEYKGKVQITWRDNPLPFHKDATPAAVLANEAQAQGGDKAFWKVHDLLFQNQRALSRPDLENYAKQAGLDLAKVKEALDTNKHKEAIDADIALAAKMGARGTPGFFINGRQLMGAQPYEKFKEVIDDEITRAEGLMKAGVDRDEVYAAFMKNALASAAEKPAPEQPQRPGQPDPNAVYKVPVGKSPIKGAPDALVTIIEFSEFQCPFCSRVVPTIQQVQKTYGKNVRVAFKHNPLPFHQNAMPASEAAMEVQAQLGDKGFWAFHDVLFENQKALSRPDLEKYAAALNVGGKKVNMAAFKKALDNHTHQKAVEAEQAMARQFGASGTPSFFINGRNLRGAQPFEQFKSVIDEELKKAEAKVKAGTPRANIYEETIKNGQTGVKAAAAAPSQAAPDADKVYAIKAPAKAPRMGKSGAPVQIQIFSEFQCPFCKRVEPTIDQFMKEYNGKVELIWRDYPLPFHQNAMPAAEAGREVLAQGGPQKFWAFHDLLFENQQSLSRENIEKYAAQVGGINMARFKKSLGQQHPSRCSSARHGCCKTSGRSNRNPCLFHQRQADTRRTTDRRV